MDFKFDNIFEGINLNPDIVGQTTREINEEAEKLMKEQRRTGDGTSNYLTNGGKIGVGSMDLSSVSNSVASRAAEILDNTKKTMDRTTSKGVNTAVNTTSLPPNNNSNVNSLKLNNDGITQIISSINETINSVNEEWDNIVKNDVNVINNSWASKDAKSYVDKLLTEGNKIKDVVAALKLLSNTYQKVINESENVQQDVQNSINRI